MIRIEWQRILLRDMEPDDLEVLAWWLQPEHRWQELDGPLYEQPSPERITRILDERRQYVETETRPRPRTWLTIADSETGEMIGRVTWRGNDCQPSLQSNLDVVIFNPDLWGYGLGYEALGLWCEYLFAELPDAASLDLRTWGRNIGMIRLAGKLGFVAVGEQRRTRFWRRRGTDVVAYALSRADWQERFPEGFRAALSVRS
jgi:RimJ/RimL family protein N-acetyltransferase